MMTTSIDSSLQQLEERHRALVAELSQIGMVLRGSIARRLTRCGNPTCRCKANPPRLHGPYYIWTRKVSGKTVSAMLPPDEAARCLEWSRNMRRFDKIGRQLHQLGLRAASLLQTNRRGAPRGKSQNP